MPGASPGARTLGRDARPFSRPAGLLSFARSQELLMSARSLCLVLCCPALLLLATRPGRAAGGPPEVAVSRPLAREVTDFEEFTGRTEAVQAVELRARVT